jgi:hypothetical protein
MEVMKFNVNGDGGGIVFTRAYLRQDQFGEKRNQSTKSDFHCQTRSKWEDINDTKIWREGRSLIFGGK